MVLIGKAWRDNMCNFYIDSTEDLIAAFEYFSWTQGDIDKLRQAIDKYQYNMDLIPSTPNKRNRSDEVPN